MDTRESVHDNWLYAETVEHDRCRVVLHTVYPHSDPPEFTDIVFEGVVVHHFEQQKVAEGHVPSTVLFEVEESEPKRILTEHTELLTRTKKYGWPISNYDGLDDLSAQLTANGAKCFEIHSVCGVQGFVFATSMKFLARKARAEISA
jgi:hypothetical protein